MKATTEKPRNAINAILAARLTSEQLHQLLNKAAKKRRLNYQNIAATCEHLLAAIPINEPTSTNVAETGQRLFPSFPAKQTLDNDYRQLLNVWRMAYAEILRLKPRQATVSALKVTTQEELEKELGILRAEISILEKKLKQAELILALKPIGTPADATEAWAMPDTIALVAEWIRNIRDGNTVLKPLELTPSGLKIAAQARPGMIVMKPELVEHILKPTE